VILAIARTAVAFVLCVSVGAPWVALQSVAWATMLVEYSQESTLAKAVVQTFDGNHPCDLCKHVRVKQSEKKPDAPSMTLKADLLCVKRRVVLIPPCGDFAFPRELIGGCLDAPAPPVPPPRTLLV
jgi:hypothetical protein